LAPRLTNHARGVVASPLGDGGDGGVVALAGLRSRVAAARHVPGWRHTGAAGAAAAGGGNIGMMQAMAMQQPQLFAGEVEYPTGFASAIRRPGLAPGMDAYAAAGQFTAQQQAPAQAAQAQHQQAQHQQVQAAQVMLPI
jgi:hypothetical protein